MRLHPESGSHEGDGSGPRSGQIVVQVTSERNDFRTKGKKKAQKSLICSCRSKVAEAN